MQFFFQLRVEPLFETRGTAREFGEFMNETKIWRENVVLDFVPYPTFR